MYISRFVSKVFIYSYALFSSLCIDKMQTQLIMVSTSWKYPKMNALISINSRMMINVFSSCLIPLCECIDISCRALDLLPKILSAIAEKTTIQYQDNNMKGTQFKSHILNSICAGK